MLADKSGLRKKGKNKKLTKNGKLRKQNSDADKDAIKKSFFATMARMKGESPEPETEEQKVERIRKQLTKNSNGQEHNVS